MAAASRLCDLINRHLLPYLETNLAHCTTHTEKDLLLSLTRVRRDVKLWTTECYSKDEEKDGDTFIVHSCHQSQIQICKRQNRCLGNIISAMVAFLGADSLFIRHAARNLIISMSCFLIKHECLWAKFLHFILFFLETAMSSISSCSILQPSVVIPVEETLMLHGHTFGDADEDQRLQSASFVTLFNSRSLNLNLLTVAELLQTLQSILKSLKSEYDEFEEVFRQSVVSCLIKMPWDLLLEFFHNSCCMSQMSSEQEGALDIKRSATSMKNLLLGTILQLCCSLADAYDSEEDGTEPSKELAVYFQFANLVPKLFSCCFNCHMGNNRVSASGYLRHKLLVMMRRLSFHSHWKIFYPESWLKLLGNFFEDILLWSVLEYEEYPQNCLDGSPFMISTSVGYKSHSKHLKREAIFLMFKCSFALASGAEACIERACTKQETCPCGLQICRMHRCSSLLETSSWLQRCFPTDMIKGKLESYSELCGSFAAYFLQLYMEEDDMLFKMLIQLLDAPFSMLQMEDCISESFEVSKDMFHYSSIFNPVHLFHLLLHLLHYDHTVLVDYLISKDTGIHCLQYLLRSLRVIHTSWPSFKQFSVVDSESNHAYLVRRKTSVLEGPKPSSSMAAEYQGKITMKQNVKGNSEVSDANTFGNATKCLVNLKSSLEDLHRKGLFPYNPNPLLKSLSRFQELCKMDIPLGS